MKIMEKIMLIKIVKSKQYNKCILTYAKAEKQESENFKGVAEFIQWCDDTELINKITKEDFLRVIDAETGYSTPDYNGKCSLQIKKIILNGKTIEIN